MAIGSDGIVILGAGQAGGRVAQHLRDKGYDGPLRMLGDEALLPYERPPLSKEFLYGAGDIGKCLLQGADFYAAQRIDPILNRSATRLDAGAKRLELSDGTSLAYDKLLIATGARARPWPGLRPDGERLHSLRNHAEALALKQALKPGSHLLVIGGGFIGLELAASARKLGCQATVLEMAPVPLGRVLPAAVAHAIAARHKAEGVALHAGVQVEGIEVGATSVQAMLTDGRKIEADIATIGIGALPNAELAAAAGLACEDGILVDESCRASAADIFAAGDATRFPSRFYSRLLRLETWDNAEKQAAVAADAMLGREAIYDELPWMWTDLFDLNIQMIGLPEPGDASVTRGTFGAGSYLHFTLREGRIRQAVLVNAGRERRAVTALIRSGKPVDPEKLADPAVQLRGL